MMNCRLATRLASDAKERKLSCLERAGLKLHVTMCSGCRNFAVQMDITRDMAQTYGNGKHTDADDSGC